jgi:hypothetical protein
MLAVVAFAAMQQGWVVVALCLLLLADKSFKSFTTVRETK